MACSCRTSKNPQAGIPYREPDQTDTNFKYTKPYPRFAVQQLDFSINTQPDQQCMNCALKHLALAVTLLELPGQKHTWLAAAQVYLAYMHLRKQLPQMAPYVKYLSDSTYLTGITEPLQKLIQHLIKKDFTIPQYQQLTLTDVQQVHILCATAYGLLFLQVGYQKINKEYAAGILNAAAAKLAIIGRRDKALELRKCWKVIQQMQQIDGAYYNNARQRLWQEIQAMDALSQQR